MGPVPRLSVEQFLHSLARTPTPTRFHRRRERLLKQSLKVGQELNYVRDDDCSTNTGIRPEQHDRAARDRMATVEPQPNIEECVHVPSDELDTPTIENKSHFTSNDLFNPPADVTNQVQLDIVVDEMNNNDADLFKRQICIAPDPPLHEHHQHNNNDDENSMFVRDNRIDEIEESQSTRKVKLDQRDNDTITADTPARLNLEILHIRSPNARENGTHEIQGNTDMPLIGDTEQPAPKPKKQIKTYGNGKSLNSEQLKTETKIPRMLPVEELQINVDRVLPNSTYDPDSEVVDYNDDPVENFSSFPYAESRQMPEQRKATRMTRKRKPLNEIQQSILKPKADDLCRYMLPSNGDISSTTRKRLKLSMACSDGFEGSEGLPTGRTMPVRLPRRHTRAVCQAMLYVPELTLVLSRECTESIAGLSELQSGDFHFSEVAECNRLDYRIVMEDLAPITEELPKLIQDSSVPIKQPNSPRLRNLKSLISPVHSGNDHVEKNTGFLAPATIRRSNRRVTFSNNVDVIQTFRMISAPIIMESGPDSIGSDSSATDDEEASDEDEDEGEDEDEEHDYRDSSGSSDDIESERDDYQSIEDEQCDDDWVEASDARCIPSASAKATSQTARHVKYCSNDEDQSPRRLVRNDQLSGSCIEGVDLTVNSRTAPHVLQSERQGEWLTADANRSQNMAPEEDHWRPRIPITSNRLIEVDDDILKYPISPNPTNDQFNENLLQEEQSQGSIELGDPKWQISYNNGYEESCSQGGSLDSPREELHCHTSEEHPKYLARALENFNNASPRGFNLARSTSVPAEQRLQERYPTGSLTTNSAFRSTAIPQNWHLSKKKNTGPVILTRSISVGAGAVPAWERIRQLSLIPPFLTD